MFVEHDFRKADETALEAVQTLLCTMAEWDAAEELRNLAAADMAS